jgi:hypothetical protein
MARPSGMKVLRWAVAIVAVAAVGIGVASLATFAYPQTSPAPGNKTVAGRVEKVPGTDVSRVVLTADAMRRLGIQTTAVRVEQGRTVIPYAAVLYDQSGATWTYTNPEPLVYVRQRITVENITGERAVLSTGPPDGTTVVTVGVAELYGTELGVGK